MPRRPRTAAVAPPAIAVTSLDADLLDSLEAGGTSMHPVDYLQRLVEHRGVLVDGLARMDKLIAEARERVICLDRDELYGTLCYATLVRTPAGKDVEVHAVPRLQEVEQAFAGRDLLVVDCETTGLDYRDGDRIVSLAVLNCRMRGILAYPAAGGPPFIPQGEDRIEVRERESWTFDPGGRRSTPDALTVHRIDDATLVGEPPFYTQAEEIRHLLDRRDAWLVAHNAPFDFGFLNAEFERAGLPPLTTPVLDTRAVSKRVWPGEPASLNSLVARFGLEARERADCHTSYGDALLLARCLPALRDAVEATLKAEAKAEARATRRLAKALRDAGVAR